MPRTNPTSIRFDPEKLELVKKRESLGSPQKVVDFLMDAYWWQNKLVSGPEVGLKTINKAKNNDYQTFEQRIIDAKTVAETEAVKWDVLHFKGMPQFDQRVLMESCSDKIRKLQNQ